MSEVIVDLPELLERVQEDHELLIELFDIFQDDYVQKRAALDDFFANKDWQRLKDIAHALKGASSNISAKQLFKSFTILEQNMEDGIFDGASELLLKIDEQYKDLGTEIIKIKKDLK